MVDKLSFRVFETKTDRDVTDTQDWYINSDGELCEVVEDINSPLVPVDDQYYIRIQEMQIRGK